RVFFAAFLALVGVHARPASAAGVAYLSRAGTGNTCTSASPCSFMGAAVAAAGTGGEVICLDKGNYSNVIITQSVTVSCGDGLWEAPGTIVTVQTPAGADVVIEG